MLLKKTIGEIVKEQKRELDSLNLGLKREINNRIDFRLSHALIISGIRRCGKSTLLHQISEKVGGFYYLNFEDPRLMAFGLADFEKLDEVFFEEYGDQGTYIFDEIQNIEKWELFVRSKLDKKKKFIITGSNASLLSKELGTRLTGRHINIELFPFSFKEACEFKKKKPSPNLFREYLKTGGMPEYLTYKNNEMLRGLFTDVIQRDIVARYNIRDSKVLAEMAIYMLTNIGKEFSYNKLKNIFNLGSVNTVSSFIAYLEDSYLLFTIPKFDYSLKKQIVNPKKVYCIDNGICMANSISFSEDNGKMLENEVFLRLRAAGGQIFYFKSDNDYECDFVVKKGNRISAAIQVCYDLNENNKEREMRGLAAALDQFRLDQGLILTFNDEDKLTYGGKTILVRPAWKWLLEEFF